MATSLPPTGQVGEREKRLRHVFLTTLFTLFTLTGCVFVQMPPEKTPEDEIDSKDDIEDEEIVDDDDSTEETEDDLVEPEENIEDEYETEEVDSYLEIESGTPDAFLGVSETSFACSMIGQWVFTARGESFVLDQFSIFLTNGIWEDVDSLWTLYTSITGLPVWQQLVIPSNYSETQTVDTLGQAWLPQDTPIFVMVFATMKPGAEVGVCMQTSLVATTSPFSAVGLSTGNEVTEDDLGWAFPNQIVCGQQQ